MRKIHGCSSYHQPDKTYPIHQRNGCVIFVTTFRRHGGASKEHPHDARRANEAGQVPRHNAQGDHGQDDLTVGVVEEGELPGDGDEDLLIWVNNDEYG